MEQNSWEYEVSKRACHNIAQSVLEMDEKIIDVTGAELKPGDPDECQGNGEHEGYECCCDECNYLGECFPNE